MDDGAMAAELVPSYTPYQYGQPMQAPAGVECYRPVRWPMHGNFDVHSSDFNLSPDCFL